MVETEELGLVAALTASGHRPVAIGRRGHRTVFAFGDEVSPLVEEFYSGRLRLPAVAMSESLRVAKAAAMNAMPIA